MKQTWTHHEQNELCTQDTYVILPSPPPPKKIFRHSLHVLTVLKLWQEHLLVVTGVYNGCL